MSLEAAHAAQLCRPESSTLRRPALILTNPASSLQVTAAQPGRDTASNQT